jgi:tetratricopeptide (TPR) repeat protein
MVEGAQRRFATCFFAPRGALCLAKGEAVLMRFVRPLRSSVSPTSRPAGALLALAALGLSTAGCETTAPQKAKTSVQASEARTAPTPVALDGAALCAARAQIEDARARNTIEALRTTLIAKRRAAPNDPIAIYAALVSMEDEQARWKAFKGLEGPLQPLRELGECEIYSSWKMQDQAASHCEAVPGGLALVDVAYADYDAEKDDHAAALAHLDAALGKTPECQVALMHKARVVEKQGDAAAIDAAWAASLNAWPACVSCAIARAKAAETSGGIEAALPLWEAALDLAPANASVLERYATAQVGRDDQKALAAYEKALQLNSESFPTLLAAARLSRTLDDTVKAVQYAEKASTVEPDNLEVWRELVGLYQAREETTGFEKALGEVLRIKPADGDAHLELARLAKKDGDFVLSLTHYEQAIAGLGEGDTPAEPPPADGAQAPPSKKLTAETELAALKGELLISEPGPSGDANQVVGQVQRTARKLFTEQKKKNRNLAGVVKLRVRTDKSGAVTEVEITDDTLKDPRVAASLVGNLRAARFDGGAQRLRFELEFE